MQVQTLDPEPAVERFDVRIIRGFSRPGEVQDTPVVIRPHVEHLRNECTAVVHLNPLGQPSQGDHMVHGRDHIGALQSVIERNGRTFSSIIIHYR